MKKTHRIVLVEDHRILREGVRSLLASDPELEIVGEAEDGLEAIQRVLQLMPDLVLMDLSMPRMDGLDALREIRAQCPDVRLLIMTVHKAEEYVFAALKSGANGYLLKDATSSELRLAISSVLAGKTYLSPGVSEKLVNSYLKGKHPRETESVLGILTQRERQILKLIAEGNANRAIANLLCISIKTVEKHRSNLMKKLDLHNASELTTFAIKNGLVTK
ncbi:DNA-binding response regulator [Desulfonema ishimotonii]|uniref:DNA-binding response regulator n=1 Tax=Desulfonema ishimotonii TaxID=45657 RepID=A0A401FZF9_9BACT|nr:response regulator transcription factor [Desulfonema ishimotonii]GBC62313.1 DNA-binding response regulator [Desulfonema ishimotonii]